MVGNATVGAAQPEIVTANVSTDYDGLSGGSQAVAIRARFTANEPITGLRIAVMETDNSFVDYGSIEPSVSGEGVNVTSLRQGLYEVRNLAEGQSVQLELAAYPRRLDQRSMVVAMFSLKAENPRTLDRLIEGRADLSSSPLIQYRQAERELRTKQWQFFGLIGGIIVGVIGIAVAGVMYRRRESKAAEAYGTVVNDLQNLNREIERPAAKGMLDDFIAEYRKRAGIAGTSGSVFTGDDEGSGSDNDQGSADSEESTGRQEDKPDFEL